MRQRSQVSPTVIPSQETIAAVRALVAARGSVNAAADLQIGRETLARLAAGFTVRRGSVALAEQRLEAIKKGAAA